MKALINSALGRLVRLLPPTEVIEGYESAELVEVLFQKTARFEPMGRWPEFENRFAVLDFGGGFGQHYKCAVPLSPHVRWAVVETPAVVRRAAPLVTERLRFFATVESAVNWLGQPELMHSDSALQYTLDPERTLEALCGVGAGEMLWKRMHLALTQTDQTEIEEQVTRLDENGPRTTKPSIMVSRKLVRYIMTKIPEKVFLAKHAGYRLVTRSEGEYRFAR
jgi:putative methyltransferase (TIGR04325 family)